MRHVALIEIKQGGKYVVASGSNKQEIKDQLEARFQNQIEQIRCLFYRTFIEDDEARNFERRLQLDKEINLKKLVLSENSELRDLLQLIP